jgi:hypothetical protein
MTRAHLVAQGEHHKKKSLKDIEQSWLDQQAAASLGKRQSKQRTMLFAGDTVLTSSMSAEGVGGLYSGLKSTANSIHSGRDKKRFVHDSICHYCKDGGDLVCCPHCPRCYHMEVHASFVDRLQRVVRAMHASHPFPSRSAGRAGCR